MRITSVSIPEIQTKEVGLRAIQMSDLGQVVVIAGKNGAGKTRLLQIIGRYLAESGTAADVKARREVCDGMREEVAALEQSVVLAKNSTDREQFERALAAKQRGLKTRLEALENKTRVITVGETGTREMVDFVPAGHKLSDPTDLSRSALDQSARDSETAKLSQWTTTTTGKISHCIERDFEATHQHFANKMEPAEVDLAIADFERMKAIVRELLGTELDFTDRRRPLLFGRPFSEKHLSPGQSALLQLGVAIHSQAGRLSDAILRLDEPESHLHPAVVIEVLTRLQRAVVNGQLWIATHSLPLIAQFSPSAIWLMESGSVRFTGTVPQRVIESLVGTEDSVAKLTGFLNLPSQLAMVNFAVEALTPPEVASPHSHDPQVFSIRESIKSLHSAEEPLRILDFGAGRGRLISSLFAESEDKASFATRYQYVAFDPSDVHSAERQNAIAAVYETADGRCFAGEEQLLESSAAGSFHCVVMCNVLHEISPLEWLRIFDAGGAIARLLRPNGVLLIVEDQCIPHGELAHRHGFIVLTTRALQSLFQAGPTEILKADARGDNRLLTHLIRRETLLSEGRSRVTDSSRTTALEDIQQYSRQRIREIRAADPSYKNGRQLAFWLQQFANSRLALDELTGPNR